MFTPVVFWLWFVGIVYLAGGLFVIRKEWAAAHGLDKWIVLGPVFVAAPLAVFATEHFVLTTSLVQLVPSFMPARLFWAYFVGCALLAAATSLVARKSVRLAATLLGVMFLLFVLLIYLPFAVAHPGTRMGWNFALRETSFAGGAWALAGSLRRNGRLGEQNWMALVGRFAMALAAIYFGCEQVLHPEFTPGVPDTQLTPAWIPLHGLWGYPVGAFLIAAGTALFANFRPRFAAVGIGVLMAFLTAFLYLPILAATQDPAKMTDAINFVADTLLFGGTALLVARAMRPEGHSKAAQ